MPAGVLVISFRVRRKETEAYVNNSAIIRKRLYIIDHRLGGELRIRNEITQAEPKKYQTNMAQCLIVGIPAQIANIEYKSHYQRPRSLPFMKNGKKRRGAEKTTQTRTTDPT